MKIRYTYILLLAAAACGSSSTGDGTDAARPDSSDSIDAQVSG